MNDIQDDADGTIDDMRDRIAGGQRAQDRIDDAQEREQTEHLTVLEIEWMIDNGNNDDPQANSADREENNEQTETQSLRSADNEESESSNNDDEDERRFS